MDLNLELTADQLAESTIVVVDDEELVTSALRNFLFLELEVEAVTFNDPKQALLHIEKNRVDLVVSDFLMPELDGIKLLAGVREFQPHVPRILLTGYADKENAIKAINDVQLYQYVEKPWDSEHLKHIIRNGLERNHLIKSLTTYVEQLAETKSDLQRLRKGLMRAFA